jgi:hypothetical protein
MPLANLAHELYGFLTQGPGADKDFEVIAQIAGQPVERLTVQ